MTDQITPDVEGPIQPGPFPPEPLSKRDAKAQAAAAKAYRESQRSWVARHKFLTGLGAIIVAIAVIVVALRSSGSGSNTVASATAAPVAAAAGTARIGAAARDGKFEFVVTKVDPGRSTIGTAPFSESAQGTFVLVHLTVKDIGTQAQMLDQSSQIMLDQNGNRLSEDPEASIYVDQNNFLADINPGNSINGTLVFDIAKNAVPTQLELHDSAFSGGVAVLLK